MKPKLAFIVLTWNSEGYIERCLRSVFSLKSFDVTAYLVDNGSSDETVSLIKKFQIEFSGIFLTELKENQGTTVPRNIALKQISGDVDFICILDSDTEINETAILSMTKCLADNNVGIVGPEMRDEKGRLQNSGRKIPTLAVKFSKILPFQKIRKWGESLEFYAYPRNQKILSVGYLMSACWVFKPSLLKRIGMLDEKIFYAPEDVDFCLSCLENGLAVVKDSNAKIVHSWQRISRRKLFSKHNWEHIKGLAYLFKKHRYLFSAKKFESQVEEFAAKINQ